MDSSDHPPSGGEETATSLREALSRERAAREQAEAELARLREVALVGVCVCDLDGRIVEANELFLRLLGSTRERLRARSLDLLELTPPELRERAVKARRKMLETGELEPGELSLLRADGKRVPVLMAGARAGGSIIFFAQDLTEARRKDGLLRSAEARLQLLLEAAPALLAEMDADGSLRALGGAERLGLSQADATARIESWARQPELVRLRERALAGEKVSTRIEWAGRLFELALAPLDPAPPLDLAPPLDPAHTARPTALLAAALEVTDRVRAQEERQRLQDWLAQAHQLDGFGALAAGLANTFNNLLAGVLANGSAARQSLGGSAPQAAALDDLLASAAGAAELSRQLLQTAAPAAAPGETLDLAGQLNHLAPLLRAGVSRRASLQLELAEALPRIRCHPDQLRRALVPLLTFALEGAREGGTLRLRTKLVEAGGGDGGRHEELAGGDRLERGWYASVSLERDGAPLDEPALARLRDPLHAARPDAQTLGIAAVLSSMRAVRGAVRIESGARATVVELLFPVSEQQPEPRPLEAPRGPAPSRRVLVVDDDPVILRAAARILESVPLPVSLASSGEEALRQVREGLAPGLVLLDFAMPGMNGEQTLRALRELRPELRALICSGYAEGEATGGLPGPPGPPWGFLAKPFTASSLQAAVLAALAGA